MRMLIITNKYMEKCAKCDERGMLTVTLSSGTTYGKSCECGYDVFLMEESFKHTSITKLFSYAHKRIDEKQKNV